MKFDVNFVYLRFEVNKDYFSGVTTFKSRGIKFKLLGNKAEGMAVQDF